MASQALNANYSNGPDPDQRLARNLGWFSIGLGATEILAPGLIARISGAPDSERSRTVIRTYGGREIAQGIAILTSMPRPAGWMWGRVAGDVLDIGSVAVGMLSRDGNIPRGIMAMTSLLGVTAIDYYCADKLSTKTPATGTMQDGRIRIAQSIIVGRSPEEVYGFWRNFENLPRFMNHLQSVTETGNGRTHWKTRAPGGSSVEWDAEITADEPNRRISWRSLPGSTVENSGTVSFERATGDRGTLIRVEMEYRPPFGKIGSVAASLFRENPKQQMYDDLRAMKQVLEVGEKAQSDASIFPTMHAAQPPSMALRWPYHTRSEGEREAVDSVVEKAHRKGVFMRANCWHGKNDVRVETVPDPKIINQTDAIIRITSSAICGSDLHLYGGFVPTMESGDILGHEFMGEVVETGRQVKNLQKGDRVVVPFPIACGQCFFCQKGLTSVCENSNPNAWVAETMLGHPISGVFGYSHMLGGYAGGQAEYARVPFADVNPLKVPEHLSDEQVLFLSDIYPTGYMGADMCDIQPGDTIAVWGCGPVGQFAMKSAFLLGAERVIGIDRFDYRLQMAREKVGAETINYEETSVLEALKEMTGGRGPDACIDAVGMEAHAPGPMHVYDRAKQAVMAESDRPPVLREAILACRNGGTVSVIGVYSGFVDKFPMGQLMNRSISIRTGQCHVHRYMKPLLDRIERGEIDPSFVITHRMGLEDAPNGYSMFRNKQDNCEKIVLKPQERHIH